jgi:hypothetical protein
MRIGRHLQTRTHCHFSYNCHLKLYLAIDIFLGATERVRGSPKITLKSGYAQNGINRSKEDDFRSKNNLCESKVLFKQCICTVRIDICLNELTFLFHIKLCPLHARNQRPCRNVTCNLYISNVTSKSRCMF